MTAGKELAIYINSEKVSVLPASLGDPTIINTTEIVPNGKTYTFGGLYQPDLTAISMQFRHTIRRGNTFYFRSITDNSPASFTCDDNETGLLKDQIKKGEEYTFNFSTEL